MTTKLAGALKREVEVAGAPYTLTIDPDGMALVMKGRRKGFELKWRDVVSGDAALATALNASLAARLTVPKETEPSARQTEAIAEKRAMKSVKRSAGQAKQPAKGVPTRARTVAKK